VSGDDFTGLWAVVTGGSRGIGHATSLMLARRGADIVVLYRENEACADATVKEIHAMGREARAHACDVSDMAVVESVLGAVAQELPSGILVNCAGVTVDRTVMKLSVEEWSTVIDTNLTGAFHCVKATLPAMRERDFGRVVNISSIIGQTGNIGQSNYAASKAGLIGLTKSLALETGRNDITVNAVCPGFIDTSMLDAVPEPVKESLVARIPKRRFGTPEEVARTVAFLAAPASGYITGAVVNVNGGMYL
jgi:NAD(P)-dependent dehydrogenase (short-subunit alcohol dehydrogenase family)